MKKVLFSLFAAIFCWVGATHAQQNITIELFYGAECPHCHEEIEWLKIIQENHPSLTVNKYEVWHNSENRILWQQRAQEMGVKPKGVPYNIVGEKVVMGFQRDALLSALHDEFGLEIDSSCGLKTKEEVCTTPTWEKWLQASWPIMAISLGLADGFNPCAMWTLFVLLGFLLGVESKKRRWLIGAVFIASSGILYFAALLTYLLGFGEVSALMATNVMDWVFRGVGLLALATGIQTLWTARRAQVECTIRDAKSRKQFFDRMKTVLEKKNVWLVLLGVTGLAFSVNAVELLCSFAIPTAFTATLVSLKIPFWEQISALVLYDIMYMLDDILVFLIAMWTMSLKVFSPKIVQWSHVVGGLLLLIIGGALLFDPSTLNQILG